MLAPPRALGKLLRAILHLESWMIAIRGSSLSSEFLPLDLREVLGEGADEHLPVKSQLHQLSIKSDAHVFSILIALLSK